MALNNPNTFKIFKWHNSKNLTEGKIQILIDKPAFRNTKGIGSELCKFYKRKIKIKKKEKIKKNKICLL